MGLGFELDHDVAGAIYALVLIIWVSLCGIPYERLIGKSPFIIQLMLRD